jgi:hypothetical protein
MIDLAENLPTPCEKSPEKYYPTIHVTRDEDLGLPESGVLTARFKVTRREIAEHNGKTTYSYTIELRAIESLEGEVEKKNPILDTEKALDALRAMIAKEDE